MCWRRLDNHTHQYEKHIEGCERQLLADVVGHFNDYPDRFRHAGFLHPLHDIRRIVIQQMPTSLTSIATPQQPSPRIFAPKEPERTSLLKSGFDAMKTAMQAGFSDSVFLRHELDLAPVRKAFPVEF